MRRLVAVLGVFAVAVLVAACGSSSAVSEQHDPQYTWDKSSRGIKDLIAEVEPYEVMPGCNPGQNLEEELSEVLRDRERGVRTDWAVEAEFQKAEDNGEPIIPTSSQEQKMCSELAQIEVEREAEEIRAGEEAQEAEVQRELNARESAEQRREELERAEEGPEKSEDREFWERTEEKAEEDATPPSDVHRVGKAKQEEIDERFAEEGGDGPG